MSALFSETWFSDFAKLWNTDPGLRDALAIINFSSTIAYGFLNEDSPRGFITVANGSVTGFGLYDERPLDWDLRASQKNWETWCNNGVGIIGLGIAYATRKLVFKAGNISIVIKKPALIGPFSNSFIAMGSVPRN